MEWKTGEEKRHGEGNSRKYDDPWPNSFRKCDDQVRGLIWVDLYPEQGSRESQGSRQVCSEFKAEECPEGLKAPKVKTEMNYDGRGLSVFFTDHFSKLVTAPTALLYFSLLFCFAFHMVFLYVFSRWNQLISIDLLHICKC